VGAQVTASRVHQLLKCARPFDPDVELEEDDPGEPARYGSAAHELMDIIVQSGSLDLEDAVNAVTKWALPPGLAKELLVHVQDAAHTLQKWLIKDNPWGEKFSLVDTEVHLAWNPATGKARGVAFDEETHHYELLPGEIGGTYDLLVKSKNRTVVLDYKTGDYGVFHEPARYPQMRTLALMTGATSVAILHTPRGGVPPVVYADDIVADDEQDFLKQLRAAMARIGDGSLTPGKEQCKYCRAICIAKNASLVEDASKSVAMVLGSPGGLSPRSAEDLGRFHMMLGDLKRLADAARADLKARVLAGEVIERPDGKVLVIEEREYETVSKSSIVDAMGKVGGEKLITALRKKGCLKVGVRQELHARK
jgi:hypothetical protein